MKKFKIAILSKLEMAKIWGAGVKGGYKVVLDIDGKTIVGRRSTSMSGTTTMADATTADSVNLFEEVEPMQKGMTFSVSGLLDPDAADKETIAEVMALWKASTKFTAKFGFGTEVGDKYEEGDAYVTDITIDGPHDDLTSYTLEVKITGEPTTGTVT